MKKFRFSFPFKKKKSEILNKSEGAISFIVVDNKAKLEASRVLSKLKIPESVFLYGIEKAYLYGEMLRRKLSKNKILVVKKNDLTKEEAYEINVEIFQRLIEQRDAIVGAIENMIQPLIRNVGGVNIELQRQKERIEYLENQVNELQEMFSSVYGKIPKMPRLPGGKKRWSRTLKEAAYEIIKHYEEDCKAEVRIYEHLRHASDDFFEQHNFIFKKDLTNDMLYENVKKANVVRGITGNRGE